MRLFGRGSGLFNEVMTVEAEEEAMQDIMLGDPIAAMEDMAAAQEFARGNFVAAVEDEMLADFF